MPQKTPLVRPHKFEGGHADFLAKTDMLRANPAAYNQLVQNAGYYNLFTEVLDSLGFSAGSKPSETPFADFYYKDDSESNYFAIGSVVTAQAAAGGNVVLALAASEMKVINGRNFSRPRKNEIIIDKAGRNWKIVAKNTTVNPHQITIRPSDSTLEATFAANDRFSIITPRYAEATGQPTGLIDDYGVYTNRFAIYKETQLTSGTAMTTRENWFTVPGLEGFAYQKGFADAEIRHDIGVSKGLVHDVLSNNLTDFSVDFDTDVPDNGTEGFLAGVQAQGKTQTYDKAAGYGLDDFERAVSWYRQKNMPGADILALQGGSVAGQVQTALQTFLGTDNADKFLANKYLGQRYKASERFNDEQLFIQLGFKGIQFGNYKFIFREIGELNNMFGENYTGDVDYASWQVFIPIKMYNDPRKKITAPSIQLLHRGQDIGGGYQRRVEIWETGGAGPVGKIKTDQFDVRRKYLRSEVCCMLVGGKWAVLQKGGSADA